MMFRLDIETLAALGDLLKRAPDIAQEEMLAAQTMATTYLHGRLTDEEPAKPGKGIGGLPRGAGGRSGSGLINSVFTETRWIDGAAIGEVATNSPYAYYVEVGTRPHTPPIQPLVDWALAVLPGVDDEEDAKRAAFAIAWKITKKGTPAKRIWKTTFTLEREKVERIFAAVPGRIVRRMEAAGLQ